MSFVLYQNKKIVGVFDDLEKCKDMVYGIQENGWASNFEIVKYKTNTCRKLEKFIVSNKDDGSSEDNSSDDSNCLTNEYKELPNDDMDVRLVQHNLNILKQQKDKIDESKKKYDVDLELYNKFKKELALNSKFEVPDMFQEKFKIFQDLESKDKLSWEEFAMVYKQEDFNGRFSTIFDITNEFDSKFLTRLDTDTEEEINSSSNEDDTSDSENAIEIIQVLNSSDHSSSESD